MAIGEKVRALVIDDEPAICTLLQAALAKVGWEVESAGSAEAAQALVGGKPFDLYMIDKNLPRMDGVEFVRWLRRRDKWAGILIITGYASVDSALDTLREGIDGYITKPFDELSELVSAAERAVAKSRSRRAVARNGDEKRPLMVLAASANDDIMSWLTSIFDTNRDTIQRVWTSRDVLGSIQSASPDVMMVDATVSDPDVTTLIAGLETSVLRATFVLVDQTPALEDLIKYIDLGVRAVLTRPFSKAEADKVEALVQELRWR